MPYHLILNFDLHPRTHQGLCPCQEPKGQCKNKIKMKGCMNDSGMKSITRLSHYDYEKTRRERPL